MRTKFSVAMLFLFAVILSHEVNATSVFTEDAPITNDPPTQIALESRH